MMKERKSVWLVLLILFVASAVFVSVFSSSTSFLYPRAICDNDSAVFQVVGENWSNGNIPYVHTWDCKGPYIHFINALGYGLTGSRGGVFILQILFLTITLLFVYKIISPFFSRRTSLLLTIVSLLLLSKSYAAGNTVIEYTLPFLLASYYYVYNWLTTVSGGSDDVDHNPFQASLYGAVLGTSLLSRLTDALGICVSVAVIAFFLMVKGRWKNLFFNILAFLAGFAIIVLPFVLYFSSKGALYDMWYGAVLYLAGYASNSFPDTSWYAFLFYFSHVLEVILIGILILSLNREKRLTGLLLLLNGVVLLAWFINSNRFPIYAMLAWPLVPIMIVEVKGFLIMYEDRLHIFLPAASIVMLTVCSLVFAGYMFHIETNYSSKHIEEFERILAEIPSEDRQEIIAYNVHPNVYLYNHIEPCNPFFCLQDASIQRNETLRPMVRAEFGKCRAKWIVVQKQGTEIEDILDSYYILRKTFFDEKYRLYSLKQSIDPYCSAGAANIRSQFHINIVRD